MKAQEKRIMGMATAGHMLVHFFESAIPPLIPLLMLQFGVDYFRMGLVVTVFSYAFGLGSLPAGFLADKIGSTRLISFYFFGAGLLSLLVFFISGYTGYILLMGAVGLFCSIYHPAANTLISKGIKERGKAFGLHGIAGSLSIAVAPLIVAFFGSRFGWRSAHLLFGAVGIAAGFFSLSLPARFSGEVQKQSEVKGEGAIRATPKLVMAAFFCSSAALGMAYKGIMTFLPAYMAQEVSFGSGEIDRLTIGGLVTTISLLSGAVGQYVGGRIADRTGPEKLYAGASFLSGIFVMLMAFTSGIFLMFWAFCFAFFFFASQPIQNFILSHYMSEKNRGLGFGFHFFVVFSIGSTAAAVSGFLADRFGLSMVFISMGACLFAAFFMGLYLYSYSKRSRNHGQLSRTTS
jgi:MFS family permease